MGLGDMEDHGFCPRCECIHYAPAGCDARPAKCITTACKVLNAGHRERQALMHWWNVVVDATPNYVTVIGPFWQALGDAQYDPAHDHITWRGETKTIETINTLERTQ